MECFWQYSLFTNKQVDKYGIWCFLLGQTLPDNDSSGENSTAFTMHPG